MIEIWKPVVGQEGNYSVSNVGRLRSEERRCFQGRWGAGGSRRVRSRILVQNPNKQGYMCKTIANVPVRVHILVLEAFVGSPPDGMQARHLDGNPANNRLENLAWGTSLQNAADRKAHGKTVYGAACSWAKLNARKVREIRSSTTSCEKMAKKFGVTPQAIWEARVGKTWRHVPF